MFEHDSPPPLHHSPSPTSDHSQFPSRDTTPATPVSATQQLQLPLGWKKAGHLKERQLPWFKKPIDVGKTTTSLCLDFDDDSFPLFGASPPHHSHPHHSGMGMAGAASPLNLNTRQTSTSPRGNQPSTLTSALQRTASDEQKHFDGLAMQQPRVELQPVHDSLTDTSRFETGARPISVKGKSNDKMRRESLAQSLGTGMSWGGVSVGSWIRDE
jgi:transcription factor SFP1